MKFTVLIKYNDTIFINMHMQRLSNVRLHWSSFPPPRSSLIMEFFSRIHIPCVHEFKDENILRLVTVLFLCVSLFKDWCTVTKAYSYKNNRLLEELTFMVSFFPDFSFIILQTLFNFSLVRPLPLTF